MTKKALFLATEKAEIFLDRIDTVFFRHGLTRIHTDFIDAEKAEKIQFKS